MDRCRSSNLSFSLPSSYTVRTWRQTVEEQTHTLLCRLDFTPGYITLIVARIDKCLKTESSEVYVSDKLIWLVMRSGRCPC